MQKKYKNLFLALVTAVLFLQLAPFALALELNYPALNFPGAPSITNATSLIQYVQYFFMFVILVTGIIAVVTIVIDGAKILLYSAGGNTDAIGEARKNIFGSVLGIILLLFSFVILRTINPELVILRDASIPEETSGMFYTFIFRAEGNYACSRQTGVAPNIVSEYLGSITGATDAAGALALCRRSFPATDTADEEPVSSPAPNIQRDMRQEVIAGGDRGFWDRYISAALGEDAVLNLTYSCVRPTTKNALVWLYSRPQMEIDFEKNRRANNLGFRDGNLAYGNIGEAQNVKVARLFCSRNNNHVLSLIDPNNIPDDVRSFAWDYQEPGVSFYFTKNCTGLSSATKRSGERIEKPYSRVYEAGLKIKSVRITNGLTRRDMYGIYLKKGGEINSLCVDEPMINPDPSNSLGPDLVSHCYAVSPEGFDPRGALIFNYRKTIPASNENAIVLDSGYRYANLTVNWLKTYNAPGAAPFMVPPPNTSLYKKLDYSPDYLFYTEAEAVGTVAAGNGLGRAYNATGDCTAANAGAESKCLRTLTFNLRKSYVAILRAKILNAAIDNNDDGCHFYDDNAFLPLFDDIYDNDKRLYRMDIIPIYQHSVF